MSFRVRLRRVLLRLLRFDVPPTDSERRMAVVGRSQVSRITRAQAQNERPSTV
jgi:hypothetical protein